MFLTTIKYFGTSHFDRHQIYWVQTRGSALLCHIITSPWVTLRCSFPFSGCPMGSFLFEYPSTGKRISPHFMRRRDFLLFDIL